MYAGSLESTRYLLLTEFEGTSACYGTSFVRSDLWPKHKARRIETRREMDEIRTEWLMTLLRIPEFLAALEINLPNGSFLKDFSCTKLHHLVLVVFTATKNGLFREQWQYSNSVWAVYVTDIPPQCMQKRVFHATHPNITKGRNWSIKKCRSCIA